MISSYEFKRFITKKIINNIFKSTRTRSSSVAVILISIPDILSSLLLLYILSKIGIVGFSAYVQQLQQLQQQNSPHQFSRSLQIARSKIQAATAPGALGHGAPSLHNTSSQDLLTILGITAVGCIPAYLIIRILLNRSKEKEKGIRVMH